MSMLRRIETGESHNWKHPMQYLRPKVVPSTIRGTLGRCEDEWYYLQCIEYFWLSLLSPRTVEHNAWIFTLEISYAASEYSIWIRFALSNCWWYWIYDAVEISRRLCICSTLWTQWHVEREVTVWRVVSESSDIWNIIKHFIPVHTNFVVTESSSRENSLKLQKAKLFSCLRLSHSSSHHTSCFLPQCHEFLNIITKRRQHRTNETDVLLRLKMDEFQQLNQMQLL